MRIGEVADQIGVSTDTIRFYEKSGLLPQPARRSANNYREYGDADVEHLRLLIDLRRLDIPLDDASRIASWCHSGHCTDTSHAMPALITLRRRAIAQWIASPQALDRRLASLEQHLATPIGLTVLSGPCCDAAGAVIGAVEGSCPCCSVGTPA